ncbi:protein ROOT HAIR DEFECTIVE 3 homolog 2-like [Rutidosis leptorrhynchoides]|uniref:protein ROOT HAIR DEFECTIVE 3 homolog 2-like n=1 Tax=Rutidosis leptorrhynchoides TaxID=125765 RepID=UPI003A990274
MGFCSKPEVERSKMLDEYFDVPYLIMNTLEKLLKTSSIDHGGLASYRQDVDGSAFSLSSRTIWEQIKKNEDLDLPAHKVVVTTFRNGRVYMKS